MALSESTFEYVVKAIFVHLDDQNEEIQLVIFNVLKFAAKLRPEIVLEEGKKNIKKQKYPRKCQELINFSEEKIEENKSIIQEEIKN